MLKYLLLLLPIILILIVVKLMRTGGKTRRWISPSIYTILDSYHTFVNNYQKNQDNKIPMEEFMRIFNKEAKYKMKTVKEVSKYTNVATDRLKAKTPETAYPEDDRPRGDKDIDSIKYHMDTDIIEPLIVLDMGTEKIMIDGMHRLVAANLRGFDVECVIVPLKLYFDNRKE